MALADPVIFIPGITASYLTDEYPVSPENVWRAIHKDYERISLHPDNPRYEVREPARLSAGQLYEIAYEEIIEELRDNLSSRYAPPVPVYPFPYDWRLSLDQIEARLAEFVEEVIERTRLMSRTYPGYADCKRVNLVGHSMGGLIIAGYLAKCMSGQKESKVGKVVSLASPFQGSYEAVVKVTTGTAILGMSRSSSRERRAARLMPSLYHLIPSFENALDIGTNVRPVADQEPKPTYGESRSWFDPHIWQPSIVESIADYIGRHSTHRGNKQAQLSRARELFAGLLTTAANHRAKIDGLKLDTVGLRPNDWLCIVGVGARTRVALRIRESGQSRRPEFRLRGSDRKNLWRKAGRTPNEQRMTGDETVPFEGAIPKFLDYENLVCVTPEDFGYWEVADRVFWLRAGGFHGILPNMNLLHRMIVRHFVGQTARHSNTWGYPPPGVQPRDWKPPIRLRAE